jgi:hypothetical protein
LEHAPQWNALLDVSTQAASHSTRSALHVAAQRPTLQTGVAPPHAWPQAPQFVGSERMSTQAPSQSVSAVRTQRSAVVPSGRPLSETGEALVPGKSSEAVPQAKSAAARRTSPEIGRRPRIELPLLRSTCATFGASMADPLVVLVLVASADLADPSTTAITTATRRALPPDSVVLVSEQRTPGDDEALALGERLHASNVAVVSWEESTREHVVVHLHRADGWFDRRFTFLPDDAPVERGRSVGLILASLISGDDPGERASPPPLPPPPPPPPPPPAETKPLPPSPRPKRWAVDAVATGALGGDATSLGPAAAVRSLLFDPLAIGVFAGVRFGDVGAAGARSTQWLFGAGLAVRLVHTLSLRADVLANRQELARGALSRSRWVGGTDLRVEWSRAVTRSLAIVVSGGVEAMFGATPVRVGDVRVGTLPVLRGVADLGGRVRF